MDIKKIIIAIIIVSLLSGIMGLMISIFSNFFYVNENKLEEEVLKRLPGYNCGACGRAGCRNFAKAIIEKNEDYNKCRPMKQNQKEEMQKFLNEIKK